jgi:hypothetical protein
MFKVSVVCLEDSSSSVGVLNLNFQVERRGRKRRRWWCKNRDVKNKECYATE